MASVKNIRLTSVLLAAALLVCLISACAIQTAQTADEPTKTPDTTPTSALTPTSMPENPSSQSTGVGDIIQFGGHDWRVLEVQDNKALIISDKILELLPYNVAYTDVTWETCKLRQYLNNDFYNSFYSADRSRVVEATIINDDNQWFGTRGGKDTTDRVFLLSLEELVKYFGDSGQLANYPGKIQYLHDKYNISRIAYNAAGVAWRWWLRSPGYGKHNPTYVFDDGRVNVYGYPATDDKCGVRPALWLKLES